MKKSTFLNEFIVHFSLRMRQKIRINLCGGCQVPPAPVRTSTEEKFHG
jgi:hypothetical protein